MKNFNLFTVIFVIATSFMVAPSTQASAPVSGKVLQHIRLEIANQTLPKFENLPPTDLSSLQTMVETLRATPFSQVVITGAFSNAVWKQFSNKKRKSSPMSDALNGGLSASRGGKAIAALLEKAGLTSAELGQVHFIPLASQTTNAKPFVDFDLVEDSRVTPFLEGKVREVVTAELQKQAQANAQSGNSLTIIQLPTQGQSVSAPQQDEDLKKMREMIERANGDSNSSVWIYGHDPEQIKDARQRLKDFGLVDEPVVIDTQILGTDGKPALAVGLGPTMRPAPVQQGATPTQGDAGASSGNGANSGSNPAAAGAAGTSAASGTKPKEDRVPPPPLDLPTLNILVGVGFDSAFGFDSHITKENQATQTPDVSRTHVLPGIRVGAAYRNDAALVCSFQVPSSAFSNAEGAMRLSKIEGFVRIAGGPICASAGWENYRVRKTATNPLHPGELEFVEKASGPSLGLRYDPFWNNRYRFLRALGLGAKVVWTDPEYSLPPNVKIKGESRQNGQVYVSYDVPILPFAPK